jgi:hypothetical protein
MLWTAINRAGRRIAAAAALVYLASVIAPSLALAFSNGAISTFCFDEIAQQVAAVRVQGPQPQVHAHIHADGTVHYHADHANKRAEQPAEHHHGEPGTPHHDDSHDANCCGAYGFTAVLPLSNALVERPRLVLDRNPILSDGGVGCGPVLIDRPPILLATT